MTLKPGDINLASNNDLMKVPGGVPYEYFEMLRRDDPVHWNEPPVDGARIRTMTNYQPIGFWVLTKYDPASRRARSRRSSPASVSMRPV